TGLRGRVIYPLGSSLVNSAGVSALNHARLLPGAYVVPACEIEATGAFTSTAPIGAYRRAGRAEPPRALARDPPELRRRNFIPPEAFPYRTATGQVYDSGRYAQALDRALE